MFSRISFLIILLHIIISGASNAQELEAVKSQNELSFFADSLFSQDNFADAVNEYKQLLERYPQDPDLHYKVGVCYLMASRNFTSAIEHLTFASTREAPNLVYYYLGFAHQLNYEFDKAISYYRRFVINGGDPKVTSQEIEQRVSQCENGNFLLRYVYEPKVLDRKSVAKKELQHYIVTKPEHGSFILKPNDLKTTTDKKQDDFSIIFYPDNPQPGDKIVYASYGSTTSIGKDLFMIEMLEEGYWSKPESLGDVINTNFNEDFPYLSPDGVTLYFASKGHYSMGGYDIYKSVYNPSAQQWSTPENLGFPFSSPLDDFLFIPDEDENLAVLVTNRNSAIDSVDVVLIQIEHNPIRRTINFNEEIVRIAKLKPKPSIDKPHLNDHTAIPKPIKEQPKMASFSIVENDPEYARALATGFTEQMKADSLRQKLEALRDKFEYIYTAEDRRALEQQVVATEDALLQAQKNADVQFARASQIEQEYLTGKRKPVDEPTASFASDNPQFLYQAQFAPTVFQSEELNQLARLERQANQIDSQRRLVFEKRELIQKKQNEETDSIFESQGFRTHYQEYLKEINSYNSIVKPYVTGKKRLYNECISVALMKRGASGDVNVRREIDQAKNHFRAAAAIRNNATDESMIESEFDAILLEELGVLRQEVAFARLWEMKLFEQQVLSKIYRLEHNIFGRRLPDTSLAQTNAKEEPRDELQSESIKITRVQAPSKSGEALSLDIDREVSFDVVEESPYNNNNPIPSHEPLPAGVIYKIQLAAFSNPVKIDFFKGMIPIWTEPVSGGKITKYYAGMFRKLADAEKALPIVRSKGFRDAFIVAWHNGRSVTPSRAKALEETEIIEEVKQSVTIDIAQDNNIYVIQLGTFSGRLPEDFTQTVRALAPGKDIVRKSESKAGSFSYSIGPYTDATEANRIRDNLVAAGVKNAFVVAVELDN